MHGSNDIVMLCQPEFLADYIIANVERARRGLELTLGVVTAVRAAAGR